MKKSKLLLSTAISSLVALGSVGLSTAVNAAPADMEKCYGVVKAGKNDCQTASGSCAGTSSSDGQKEAWLFVPRGTCKKIVGGTLKSDA